MKEIKEMAVSWNVNQKAKFNPVFFLQGDFGIGSINVDLYDLNDFQGNMRAVFCGSNNPQTVYVVEENVVNSNVKIEIPNEILREHGKVYCRLVLRSTDRKTIIGSVQEIYFHVVAKNDWELIEPLLPCEQKEYVKDVVDELYEILRTSKQELKDYAESLKGELNFKTLTLEEAKQIINKYKNKGVM